MPLRAQGQSADGEFETRVIAAFVTASTDSFDDDEQNHNHNHNHSLRARYDMWKENVNTGI